MPGQTHKRTVKLLIIFVILVVTIGNYEFASTAYQGIPWQVPDVDFWPLPSESDTYWWIYEWEDGDHSANNCVPGLKHVAISAKHYNDGAFENEQLLSFNIFKDDPCTYWWPDHDLILRWYSRGFTWVSWGVDDMFQPQQITAHQFLSFRGDSRWCPDRSQNTKFLRGTTISHEINGKYTLLDCDESESEYAGGTRYGRADHPAVPLYAVVPDIPLNANLQSILSASQYLNYCKFHPSAGHTWQEQKDCDPLALQVRNVTVTPIAKMIALACIGV